MQVSRHHSGGVAPFGYLRIIACMQLPSNVSPVSASFIGLKRQGIHRVLCVACSFLAVLLFCMWFSVFLLAVVLSKIEGISCIQLSKCMLGMIPNNWRVETRQRVWIPCTERVFLFDLEVDEIGGNPS